MNAAESSLEAKGWEKRVCDGGTVRWWKRFDSLLFKCPPNNRFTKSLGEYVPGIQASVDFRPDWTEIRLNGYRDGKWKLETFDANTPTEDLDRVVVELVGKF